MTTMTAPAPRWPFPGDNAIARARKVAQAYRAALGLQNRALRDDIDEAMCEAGETWVTEREIVWAGDGMDALTTAQAAELAHVPTYEVSRWATMEWPGEPGRPLLPRFRRQGRTMTYLARDVVAAARVRRGSAGLPSVEG